MKIIIILVDKIYFCNIQKEKCPQGLFLATRKKVTIVLFDKVINCKTNGAGLGCRPNLI